MVKTFTQKIEEIANTVNMDDDRIRFLINYLRMNVDDIADFYEDKNNTLSED